MIAVGSIPLGRLNLITSDKGVYKTPLMLAIATAYIHTYKKRVVWFITKPNFSFPKDFLDYTKWAEWVGSSLEKRCVDIWWGEVGMLSINLAIWKEEVDRKFPIRVIYLPDWTEKHGIKSLRDFVGKMQWYALHFPFSAIVIEDFVLFWNIIEERKTYPVDILGDLSRAFTDMWWLDFVCFWETYIPDPQKNRFDTVIEVKVPQKNTIQLKLHVRDPFYPFFPPRVLEIPHIFVDETQKKFIGLKEILLPQ